MLRMKMEQSIELTNLIKAIATIIDEATFQVSPETLKFRGMDPSKTAMVDFELPKDAFSEYEVSKENYLCLQLGRFLKLLKTGTKDESVELSLDEDTARLRIKFTKASDIREFTMPTLESPEDHEVPTPKVAFNVNIKMLTSELKNKLEDAILVSNMVKLIAEPKKLVFDAEGDLMTSKAEIKKGSDRLLVYESKESSKATYSLTYLMDILKEASVIVDLATIEFSTDMPLKLDFNIKTGKFHYYLAPRIEIE